MLVSSITELQARRGRAPLTRLLVVSLLTLLSSGCAFMGRTQPSIPTELIAAPSKTSSQRLVIVLPGLGDDLHDLRNAGIVQAVQAGMPDADVLLVELTYAYYSRGRAIPRLHDEIVMPARRSGYREITLAGASLGGMGTLLYEHRYPGQMQHLVLLAPYMGSRGILTEIDAAGGLARWDPGNLPAIPDPWAAGRIEWLLVKSWLRDRSRVADVWLVCGDTDRFIKAARKIEPVLLADNYVELAGGHKWKVWTQGAQEVFARISSNLDRNPGNDPVADPVTIPSVALGLPTTTHGDHRQSARASAASDTLP